MKTKQLKDNLFWVGNLDPSLRVFDIIMMTEFGTSYNSYVLRGSEKNVIFETSKAKCFDEYIEKVEEIVPIRSIDYIVVDHTEPDHAGSVERLLDMNPKLKIVGTASAINFMKEICNKDFTSIVVKEGDELSLGDKTLRFIMAPNLHWPDSMYTYIVEDNVLVTCDSFGSHYSSEGITNDKIENQEDYMKALKYYYDMIIGPFKSYALDAIEKIKDLNIEMICPGHGPVLIQEPRKIVEIYKAWSTEVNPNSKKTIVIPYVSAYGYTGIIAEKIGEGIKAAGDIDVKIYDLVEKSDGVLEELYWADGILLGTPTIVGEALKPIWDLTTSIFAKTHGGKIASAFGSYGWSGEGVPNIIERLKQLKMKVYGEGLKIRFKPNDIQLQEAFEFGYGFGSSVMVGKIVKKAKPANSKRAWKCLICGEIIYGDEAPEACPVCGVGPDQFIEVEISDVTFHSDKKERFVIVGNGAAGTAACEAIRCRNEVCSIELISEEDVIGYNRPMLTKGIMTEIDPLNFFIKPYNWYKENNITHTLNTGVTAIDPQKKVVKLTNGEERPYDKLILATGAQSMIPPIKGVDYKGVFSIRTLTDVNRVEKALDGVKEVTVIGGGVLGLEAAWEFKKAEKEVTVIELAPLLMGRQLDERGSQALKAAVENSGIKVFTGVGIECIEGTGDGVTSVKLADGTQVKAQMVILSTGVKPNVSIAVEAGVQAGRSIIVNEKMETSVPDIYACGDCAEYEGLNYGIWNQAIDMGRIAGLNAVGDSEEYEQVIPANSFHGMGTSLFAIGDTGKDQSKKYKSIEILDEARKTYEKLYAVNNRFCGGILMGDVTKAPTFLEAYKDKEMLTKMF